MSQLVNLSADMNDIPGVIEAPGRKLQTGDMVAFVRSGKLILGTTEKAGTVRMAVRVPGRKRTCHFNTKEEGQGLIPVTTFMTQEALDQLLDLNRPDAVDEAEAA